MPIDESTHLLACLAEECAEVTQRIMKAVRFALTEIQPGQPLMNAERIVVEMLDLFAVAEMLHDAGAINMEPPNHNDLIAAKKLKVAEFMRYAESVGALDRQRALYVSCPQCGGSGATVVDEDEDNCDLCAAKGFALLDAVLVWERDL
jgi:hypothetical protein